MKALVYHGPGERGWDSVDDPTIVDPSDIIVRIDTSTICGTDLHILKGDSAKRSSTPPTRTRLRWFSADPRAPARLMPGGHRKR